jgi:hypothetical protein
VAALREQLDARLRAASEGSAPLPDAAAEAHGREVWTRCEALTAGESWHLNPACVLQLVVAGWGEDAARAHLPASAACTALPLTHPSCFPHCPLPPAITGLVGELAEQLRLILEPTLASRLAGDYRSGKRINMKKVRRGAAAGVALRCLYGAASISPRGTSTAAVLVVRVSPHLAMFSPPCLLPASLLCPPLPSPPPAPSSPGHRLHCLPLSQRQDLAAPHPPRQAALPGSGGGGRLAVHGGDGLRRLCPGGLDAHLPRYGAPRGGWAGSMCAVAALIARVPLKLP